MGEQTRDIEMQLRHRVDTTSRAVCAVTDSGTPGSCGKAYRSALREAVQRRDSAQDDLDHFVRRVRGGVRPPLLVA